jgi:acetoin utilization protein AcuB
MLVKNWMSKPAITVDLKDSMSDANKLLRENNISMLPVMKKERLVGVITDRDLKKASASDATTLDIHELLYLTSKIKIKTIMTKDPVTVPPDFSVEETAEILLKNKISGVPVKDDQGQVLGVITQNDLFRVLISLTGVEKRGVQFAFLIEDWPGSIKTVADVIRNYNGRMVSILTSYEQAPAGYRKLYIRAYHIEREKLSLLTQDLKERATMLYMVDHREDRREVYIE